ncbi:uncharacterized protein LOC135146052 [Zophobas morio]|uniref:uncharacterized protein LOC135146052 n=1 Tax=Zophobas morio TaxID=2755281 RepID=UPI003082A918
MTKEMWEFLFSLKAKNVIEQLGACELTVEDLEQIYSWTGQFPSFVQVTLHIEGLSCPLLSFLKEHNIKIMSNHDATCFIPDEVISSIINKFMPEDLPTDQLWTMSALVRYSTHIDCQSVLSSKGYIVYVEPVSL